MPISLQEALSFNACISAFDTDLTVTPLMNRSLFSEALFYALIIKKGLSKKEDAMCPLPRWIIHIHNLNHTFPFQLNLGRDSSDGRSTRYGLDGPGIKSRWGARFSAPDQTYPGAHLAYYQIGTGSFPGVKRPRRGDKERVDLYLYSPSGSYWPVLRRTLPLPLPLPSLEAQT